MITTATQGLVGLALLLIVSISMCPCVRARAQGAYATGINHPDGPPVSLIDTGYWLRGPAPFELRTSDFNGDSKLGIIAAAYFGYRPGIVTRELTR
jgi:hypothetical protein